jgi:PLP dependent protein
LSIAANLECLQEEIAAACAACGRRPGEITLVAVSKTVSVAAIQEAYAAGQRDFGENRAQELERKRTGLSGLDLRWHMLGSLQTNKVRHVLPGLTLLHSLDRPALADEIERLAPAPVPVLLQVNTTGETSKSGVRPESLFELADRVRALPKLRIEGLMTIGPLGGDEEQIRRAFALLRRLREELAARHRDLALPVLSMGMSEDFALAIREGTTLVRIGTRFFGPRGGPARPA